MKNSLRIVAFALVALALELSTASAVQISVANASFEVPDLAPGVFTTTAPPGWLGGTDAGVHNTGEFGSPTVGGDGGQVGFLGNGGGFTNLFQDIAGAGVGTPDVTGYRLTVSLAHRGDAGAGNVNIGIDDLTGVGGAVFKSVDRLSLNNTLYRDFALEISAANVAAGDTLRVFIDKTGGNLVVLDDVRLEAISSNADPTLAHWRFEQGPAGANVPQPVFGFPNGAPSVPDASGNGNDLRAFGEGGCCGFTFNSDVPASTVPGVGANNFSIQNSSGFPASYSEPGGPLSSLELAQWTVEASYNPESNGGFRTIVGRDGQGIADGDGALAALYLQVVPNDALAIKFVDEDGVFHVAESAAGVIQAGQWHNIAATSDGTTLSLFVDTGSGYELIAQTALAGSANTALTDGFNVNGGINGASDWGAGDWSVGRGLFNGGHVDRAIGLIDEVRITAAALDPNQFIFAPIPEPTTALLGLLGVAGLARRRRAA